MTRKLWEANAKIADWGGFTPEEMGQHALDMGCATDVTCATAKEKEAVLKFLKGKRGADRVDVLTLDEYNAKVHAAFEHIARTAVNPETTSFSNPEPEPEEKVKGKRRRVVDNSTVHPDGPHKVNYGGEISITDEETGTTRFKVSKRSKKMINPAFAPKKRGG